MFHPRFLLIVSLILAGAATRLLPHPPNMTAVGAMALFGGAYFYRRWQAVLIPLGAMLLSDIVLSLTIYREYGFSWAPVTYVCMALTVPLGMTLRNRVAAGRVAGTAVLVGVLFFLVSNFFEWLGSERFSQTPAGLLACYAAGLPFAMNMVVGNLLYSGLLFGGMEVFQWTWPRLRETPSVPLPAAAR
jgi:hypothetical protein